MNSKDDSKMSHMGCGQVLTNNVNSIGNVMSNNSEIYKTANQLSIEFRIRKRSHIFDIKFGIGLNMSCNDLVVSESDLRNKISCIFCL